MIEDSWEVVGILFEYYESKGVELDYVDNGELGFEFVKVESFDLILFDLMLLWMDGLMLCNKFRDEGIIMFILMLMVFDNREDMLNGFKYGVDDYLIKLFDFDVFDVCVNVLIKCYKG